jgi:hypothetical protein
MTVLLRLLPAFASLLLLVQGPYARAQDIYGNARSMGMADAFVAGNGNGSLYANPAGLLAVATYAMEAGFHRNSARRNNGFGTSLVDSTTNPNIAAGVGYSYTFGPGPGDTRLDDARDHDLRLGVAAPLMPGVAIAGIGLNYESFRTFRTVTDAPPIGLPTEPTVREEAGREGALTMDAGLLVTYQRQVAVGVTARNLLQPSAIRTGREYVGGVAAFLGPAHIELQYAVKQALEDPTEFQGTFAAGLEVLLARVVPIRTGVRTQGTTPGPWIAAGTGYRAQSGGFDIGFQQSTQRGSDRVVMASFLFYR